MEIGVARAGEALVFTFAHGENLWAARFLTTTATNPSFEKFEVTRGEQVIATYFLSWIGTHAGTKAFLNQDAASPDKYPRRLDANDFAAGDVVLVSPYESSHRAAVEDFGVRLWFHLTTPAWLLTDSIKRKNLYTLKDE